MNWDEKMQVTLTEAALSEAELAKSCAAWLLTIGMENKVEPGRFVMGLAIALGVACKTAPGPDGQRALLLAHLHLAEAAFANPEKWTTPDGMEVMAMQPEGSA